MVKTALVLAAAAASVAAAPATANGRQHKRGIRDLPIKTAGFFSAYSNEVDYLQSNNLQYKYGEQHDELPALDTRDIEVRAAGEASLKSLGVAYTVEVEIGTPPQKFDALFDTGSSVMWVISQCNDQAECGNAKPLFDQGASSSLVQTNKTFSLQYGKGSASGKIAYDQVAVGGQKAQASFITVDKLTEWGRSFSALIGFSPRTSSWYQRVAGEWAEPLFGMYLARTTGGSDSNLIPDSGMLTLGGIDNSRFTGDVHYIDANTTSWWAIPLDGLKANGQDVNIEGGQASSVSHIDGKPAAVVDSGTTLIYGPKDTVTELYTKLGATEVQPNLWLYRCPDNGTQGPQISFTFGGQDYAIDDRDLVVGASTVSYIRQNLGKTLPGADGDYYCRAGIDIFQAPTANFNTPQWILGGVFLRSVYTVHRTEPPAVGFAKVVDSGSSDSGKSVTEGGETAANGLEDGNQKDVSSARALGASSAVLAAGLAIAALA